MSAQRVHKTQLRIAVASLNEREATPVIKIMLKIGFDLIGKIVEREEDGENESFSIEIDLAKYIDNFRELEKAIPCRDICFMTVDFMEKHRQHLHRLHKQNPDCHIIVCGGTAERLTRYLRARPAGFLSSMDRNDEIVDLWVNCAQEQAANQSMVYMETKQGVFVLSANEILYCQSDLKYVNVVTVSGKVFRKIVTLNQFSTLLPDYFVRIHQSFLVNWHRVEKVSRSGETWDLQVEGDYSLPISRSYRSRVAEMWRG